MNFSSKLKKYRKANHLTQEDVSKKLNVSRKTVSSWENGRHYPDFETIVILSDLYNVSLDELMKNSSKDTNSQEINKSSIFFDYFEKFVYYMNIFLLIVSTLKLLIPIHFNWVTPALVINLCVYILIHRNWNMPKLKSDILKCIFAFIMFFSITFLLGMYQIERSLSTNFAIPDSIGVLIHVITISISFIIALRA